MPKYDAHYHASRKYCGLIHANATMYASIPLFQRRSFTGGYIVVGESPTSSEPTTGPNAEVVTAIHDTVNYLAPLLRPGTILGATQLCIESCVCAH